MSLTFRLVSWLQATKARITAHGMLPTVQARWILPMKSLILTTIMILRQELFITTTRPIWLIRAILITEDLMRAKALSTTDPLLFRSRPQTEKLHIRSEHVIITIRAATESQTSALCLLSLLRPIRKRFVTQ